MYLNQYSAIKVLYNMQHTIVFWLLYPRHSLYLLITCNNVVKRITNLYLRVNQVEVVHQVSEKRQTNPQNVLQMQEAALKS